MRVALFRETESSILCCALVLCENGIEFVYVRMCEYNI